MRLETQGSKVYLVNSGGVLHASGTLFLNQVSTNPHTLAVLARAIRVWARLATAFDIDLATRALDARWLSEREKSALKAIVFSPIEDIEKMSDHAVRDFGLAAKVDKTVKRFSSVESNTARKQLVGIAKYLEWFYWTIIAPRLPLNSPAGHYLQTQVKNCSDDLKAAVAGTQTTTPYRIRSVPTERFLQIYSAVFLEYREIFRTSSGNLSATAARDRAMILLAGEGVRPGAIGNLALADFRWEGHNSPGYLSFKDNTFRRNSTVKQQTPVQKGASNQSYNSLITIQVWATTAQAIQHYIDGERQENILRGQRNRSRGFLFLGAHGGPIDDRGTISRIFRQASGGLAKMGLLDRDPKDPYLEEDLYYFHAYLLRHSAASLFFATKSMEMKGDVVMDLMKKRFGWSDHSAMPALYAKRAMTDSASLTLDDYMEALFLEAKSIGNSSTNRLP